VARRLKRSLGELMGNDKIVRITLLRSVIGTKLSHRATVLGLGLKRIGQTVMLKDSAEIRGMIKKVSYLLKAEG
jgi:large subunit ribosomal protein L30